jgi:hypothetical protein
MTTKKGKIVNVFKDGTGVLGRIQDIDIFAIHIHHEAKTAINFDEVILLLYYLVGGNQNIIIGGDWNISIQDIELFYESYAMKELNVQFFYPTLNGVPFKTGPNEGAQNFLLVNNSVELLSIDIIGNVVNHEGYTPEERMIHAVNRVKEGLSDHRTVRYVLNVLVPESGPNSPLSYKTVIVYLSPGLWEEKGDVLYSVLEARGYPEKRNKQMWKFFKKNVNWYEALNKQIIRLKGLLYRDEGLQIYDDSRLERIVITTEVGNQL